MTRRDRDEIVRELDWIDESIKSVKMPGKK